MVITATTNSNIKALRALYRDKKTRYAESEFVAEGATIVKDIPSYAVKRIFIKASEEGKFADLFADKPRYIVKDEIFDAVADTKTPSGIIAVVDMPKEKPVTGDMTVVLCGVSDAGNVGTIIRTACAKGIETVICVDTADPYSPKAVRASMGGINKINVVRTSIDGLKNLLVGYQIAVLDMRGIGIYSYKQKGKLALLVGNEAHGVPDEVKNYADIKLSVPMKEGSVESLNAAVAISIAMYAIN